MGWRANFKGKQYLFGLCTDRLCHYKLTTVFSNVWKEYLGVKDIDFCKAIKIAPHWGGVQKTLNSESYAHQVAIL